MDKQGRMSVGDRLYRRPPLGQGTKGELLLCVVVANWVNIPYLLSTLKRFRFDI